METVHIPLSSEYCVCIGSGIFPEAGARIAAVTDAKTVMIVSDSNVYALYGVSLHESLTRAGFRTASFVFPAGEQSKSVPVWTQLLERLCAEGFTRSDIIVSLGGGVTGDLAGFAAAVYQRGIGYVQIPTTLLAAVDASVGGKTAVNLAGGKNQAGRFHQPLLVLCDPLLLSTLSEKEYRCGCAEIVKYAMIGSEQLFGQLESASVRDDCTSVIAACVTMKRDLIVRDEFDTGDRMLLNFGHTVGHAAEYLSGFTLSHGECVAAGMAVMTRAAAALGLCPPGTSDRLIALLHRYGLPAAVSFSAEELYRAAQSDKKNKDDTIRVILPERIGSCRITEIPRGDLLRLLQLGGAG